MLRFAYTYMSYKHMQKYSRAVNLDLDPIYLSMKRSKFHRLFKTMKISKDRLLKQAVEKSDPQSNHTT